jgi:hypothetical protein
MYPSLPCEALEKGKRLERRYDRYSRTVEVHAVGQTQDGDWLMLVWQVRGRSVSDERAGWKTMRLAEAGIGAISEEVSQAPRRLQARKQSHGVRSLRVIARALALDPAGTRSNSFAESGHVPGPLSTNPV